MYDMPVRRVMQRRKMLKAPPEANVSKVAKLMARRNAGAVMIVEDERLVGIFTERDLVCRVVAPGLDPRTTLVADVMTPAPHTVGPDRPFGYALLVMHEKGFRHMPVIEDDRLVGVVSSRSALDPDLEEFTFEAERRKHYRDPP